MQLGEVIGVGRDADVFAVDDELVLRRYRDGSSARSEVELMAYLASQGYPVPAVYPSQEYPNDLLMERLTGPTMLAALVADELTPAACGRTLADLLTRLHAIPPLSGSADRTLHLDLHPDNVILSPDGPRVIDWRNSREGAPGLDWAMSGLILAQVAIGGLEGISFADTARACLEATLADVDGGLLTDNHLRQAAKLRAADPNMSTYELDRIDEAVALVRTTLAAT